MNLQDEFLKYINKENLFQKEDNLLLALSGGVDSVVLFHLCIMAGFCVDVAHCNFQLRDKDSAEDENFVKELAGRYNRKIFVKKFDTASFAADNKLSIQVAARNLRYAWFTELLNGDGKQGYKRLLTAHHADDNVETLLMNFFKGTGINGLKSILPLNGNIARPLLFAFKHDIIAYAKQHDLEYREDASNAIDKYTRNYFRNQMIPGIEKVFPRVKENLAANTERFREVQVLYNVAVERIIGKLLVKKNKEWHIPVNKLLKVPAMHSIVYEIIQAYNFTAMQVGEFIKLLEAATGSYILSPTHRALKNRNWIIISAIEEKDNQYFLLEEGQDIVLFPLGELIITRIPAGAAVSTERNVLTIAEKDLQFPLLLRPYKPGDYFYPFGMKKPGGQPMKKKISRFLMDNKLSLIEKEKVWVLESRKKIMWVLNYRPDERFRVTANSGPLVKIQLIFSK